MFSSILNCTNSEEEDKGKTGVLFDVFPSVKGFVIGGNLCIASDKTINRSSAIMLVRNDKIRDFRMYFPAIMAFQTAQIKVNCISAFVFYFALAGISNGKRPSA